MFMQLAGFFVHNKVAIFGFTQMCQKWNLDVIQDLLDKIASNLPRYVLSLIEKGHLTKLH